MITLVNFADKSFRSKQKWNSLTAKFIGKVDRVIEYSPDDIDKQFLNSVSSVLKYSKGFGNYFWKSYIINKAYKEIKEGDYLLYADSGSVFLKSILPLIDHLEKEKKAILCFKLPLIEKQWTKRDAFLLLECDEQKYIDSAQIMGGFILIKKCIRSKKFILDFLKYCTDVRVLSDDKNVLELPNYAEFISHRHDQSVLSLLCKKNNSVLLEGDLSDYGYFPHKYLHHNNYLFDVERLNPKNNIFRGSVLCNRKENPIKYAIKYYVKLFLFRFGYKF